MWTSNFVLAEIVLTLINLSLNFVCMAGITSDLAKQFRDPPKTPLGGSPGGLRTVSARTTLLVQMVSSTIT